jgi:hypothetical protein
MEDHPRDLMVLETRFSTEAHCREYLSYLHWPEGLCCPPLRWTKELAEIRSSCAMCGLRLPDFGDLRGHLSGQPPAFDSLVSCRLVHNEPEEWSQRHGFAAGVGVEELQDVLDTVA